MRMRPFATSCRTSASTPRTTAGRVSAKRPRGLLPLGAGPSQSWACRAHRDELRLRDQRTFTSTPGRGASAFLDLFEKLRLGLRQSLSQGDYARRKLDPRIDAFVAWVAARPIPPESTDNAARLIALRDRAPGTDALLLWAAAR